MNPYWRQYAECRNYDPDMWSTPPQKPGADGARLIAAARQALRICGDCPVKAECARDAARTGVIDQIRAGVPYDVKGDPASLCEHCGRPIVGRNGALARVCSSTCGSQLWPSAKAAA